MAMVLVVILNNKNGNFVKMHRIFHWNVPRVQQAQLKEESTELEKRVSFRRQKSLVREQRRKVPRSDRCPLERRGVSVSLCKINCSIYFATFHVNAKSFLETVHGNASG